MPPRPSVITTAWSPGSGKRSTTALIDGPRPPDPSGPWQVAHERTQTSRPSTRTGSDVPESAPGTGGDDPAHAPTRNKMGTAATMGWDLITRATILTPWASIHSAQGSADPAISYTWGRPSPSPWCSWPGHYSCERPTGQEPLRWRTQRSSANWRRDSSSRTKPPRPTPAQGAVATFLPDSDIWSSCRSRHRTSADTGTGAAGPGGAHADHAHVGAVKAGQKSRFSLTLARLPIRSRR